MLSFRGRGCSSSDRSFILRFNCCILWEVCELPPPLSSSIRSTFLFGLVLNSDGVLEYERNPDDDPPSMVSLAELNPPWSMNKRRHLKCFGTLELWTALAKRADMIGLRSAHLTTSLIWSFSLVMWWFVRRVRSVLQEGAYKGSTILYV